MYLKIKVFIAILFTCSILSQRNYPPIIKSDKVVTFKKTDEVDLKLWFFYPKNHKIDDKAPSIIFFFGGGWHGGSPEQFIQQAKFLARQGLVSIISDYRVKSRNNTEAVYCLKDAKSAIRWLRENSNSIGIDPNKIIGAGGSSGGHLAAASGTIPYFDEKNENLEISSKPNAMVLFNPVVILSPVKEYQKFDPNSARNKYLKKRIGVDPEKFSPYNYIDKNTPPALIFHGTNDQLVDYKTVELFDKKMKEQGNFCELHLFEGENHGFFNYNRKSQIPFNETMIKTKQFLKSIGFIK